MKRVSPCTADTSSKRARLLRPFAVEEDVAIICTRMHPSLVSFYKRSLRRQTARTVDVRVRNARPSMFFSLIDRPFATNTQRRPLPLNRCAMTKTTKTMTKTTGTETSPRSPTPSSVIKKPVNERKQRPPLVRIMSWNVAGLRACVRHGFEAYIKQHQPDIVCIQDVKATQKQCPLASLTCTPLSYNVVWCSPITVKNGYAGTAILTRVPPLHQTFGIGHPEHDQEGRVITLEFETFYLVCCYVPNSGRKLERHAYRVQEWDVAFREYLATLNTQKPVVLTGDLNVAHSEIDIHRPRTNVRLFGYHRTIAVTDLVAFSVVAPHFWLHQ